MKKIIRWTAISLLVLFVGAQFVRPAKTNPAMDESRALEQQIQMNEEVKATLKRACYDCHSNETKWPLYSQVAPISWFVIDHVNHGRRHLNFSDWARYDKQRQAEQLKEIQETVRAGAMPLASYLLAHSEAKLSDDDKKAIGDWANAERQRILNELAKNREPK
jgi:hypothetical protein